MGLYLLPPRGVTALPASYCSVLSLLCVVMGVPWDTIRTDNGGLNVLSPLHGSPGAVGLLGIGPPRRCCSGSTGTTWLGMSEDDDRAQDDRTRLRLV
ncbi:hypothetical protein BO94DRAFT_530772 [Aspergillus sclerotioniger CBS 115572]|uniref:Uncharacterized protein n=1 Tax=Aspergillus sclerotioniger CBS 115572 TaxID=1450535 RepID=A0A317XD58_9EURO|nr:hypothetical protein BO94DRAFT_530772 [Aspergillus sclerotioniger CBS 115572]PWY96081.1 hypothetical protein BO94DRAFT_530772 [Aspergillus sclerotioniger CBS 115572]